MPKITKIQPIRLGDAKRLTKGGDQSGSEALTFRRDIG
jgi:hypothetical protein